MRDSRVARGPAVNSSPSLTSERPRKFSRRRGARRQLGFYNFGATISFIRTIVAFFEFSILCAAFAILELPCAEINVSFKIRRVRGWARLVQCMSVYATRFGSPCSVASFTRRQWQFRQSGYFPRVGQVLGFGRVPENSSRKAAYTIHLVCSFVWVWDSLWSDSASWDLRKGNESSLGFWHAIYTRFSEFLINNLFIKTIHGAVEISASAFGFRFGIARSRSEPTPRFFAPPAVWPC